jgi:predicted regulator of Ras-like GTPase activity (Roadblock/LC7/MglB family)
VTLRDALGDIIRIPGVRGALVVSREDGLIVADALMEDVDGGAVAALAASLAGRMRGVTSVLGQPEPVLLLLAGSDGMLVLAPGSGDLLLVAIAAGEVNTAELRLGLLAAAGTTG